MQISGSTTVAAAVRLSLALTLGGIFLIGDTAQGQDFAAVEKRLKAAVDAGELNARQAKAMMIALKKRAHTAGEKAVGPDASDRAGKHTREAMSKRKLAAAARDIEAAVKAGKLSAEDGKAKLAALRRALVGKSVEKSKPVVHPEEARVRRKIKAAVKAGDIGKEEAMIISQMLRHSQLSKQRRKEQSSRPDDPARRKLLKQQRAIRAAVKAGKLSPAEAKKKLAIIRRESTHR